MATKKEFIDRVMRTTGITKRSVAEAIAAQVMQAVMDEARAGTLVLRGVGTFKTVERKARTARNPRTGDVVTVPARSVIVFKQAAKTA